MSTRTIHVSIVSHGQGPLVQRLLEDLEATPEGDRLHLTLTLNRPEPAPFAGSPFRFPVATVRNLRPAGFAANHNAAFAAHQARCPCPYFCVINPDARIGSGVLERLLQRLDEDPSAALVAPAVRSSRGAIEDSARPVPTPARILAKAARLGRRAEAPPGAVSEPDWVAGMFMLLRSAAFAEVSGFDPRYFLYYEDVDLCCRLRLAGHHIRLDPSVQIVHDGVRESHYRLRHFRWHLASMLRFFVSPVYFRSLRRQRGAWPGTSRPAPDANA